MSTTYSPGGYRIAIQARSAKTIIVEGRSDKFLLEALKLCWNIATDFVVDTADILSGVGLAGLGNKTKIDAFLTQTPVGLDLSQKLRVLVDREWEGLINPADNSTLPWSPASFTNIRVTTEGHSIENYGFDFSFVELYLSHFGDAIATPALLTDVQTAVPGLIQAAAAFSEIVRQRQLIKRCQNIFSLSDVAVTGGIVTISQNVEVTLLARGAQNAAGLMKDVANLQVGKWSNPPFSAEAHWQAHGHIGDLLLWIGIAQIALSHGFSEQIVNELAFGRQDEKRRVWHQWLCSLPPAAVAPINSVFD